MHIGLMWYLITFQLANVYDTSYFNVKKLFKYAIVGRVSINFDQ